MKFLLQDFAGGDTSEAEIVIVMFFLSRLDCSFAYMTFWQ